jgi:dTDP-glucose 4,6-dehydratase
LPRSGILKKEYDVIFDLASYGNMSGQNNIKETYKANLLRVMDMTTDNKNLKTKYIFVSTSSVLLPKQTPYSLSKKSAEDFVKYMVDTYNIKASIVRPFTVIGVGEQPEHLIPKLIRSCLRGDQMPFVSEPVHDYIDVDDFVDALLLIKDKSQFNGEVYEVGSGFQVSNESIKESVEELIGKNANIKYVTSMRSYDTTNWQTADTTMIKSLGWGRKFNLEDTLKKMIDYEQRKFEAEFN